MAASLPQELLLHIFQHLSMKESAWREAAGRPELLGSLAISLAADEGSLPRLWWLRRWLAARGEQLGSLQLEIHVREDASDEVKQEAGEPAAACALAAAAGDALRQFSLSGNMPLPKVSSWLPSSAASLRQLRLDFDCASLCLGWLEDASLEVLKATNRGGNVPLLFSHRLPDTFTRLALGGCREEALPSHLAGLTRLANCNLLGLGYHPLPALPALRRLQLDSCGRQLPKCLSQLTRLEALCIKKAPSLTEDALYAVADLSHVSRALLHLSSLTSLELEGLLECCLPPNLTARTRLRSLAWQPWQGAQLPPSRYSLPGTAGTASGAWLAGLRSLRLPAALLARSQPKLSAARQLTQVVASNDCSTAEDAQAVLRWAAEHPGLQCLVLQVEAASLGDAVAAAQLAAPSLRIQFA
ncbi:hypothetical protein ABPG75_010665 [Micractinium tetrahymenae]